MTNPTQIEKLIVELAGVSRRLVPRCLTAVCRDPHGPAFGCFDRDWWHYKLRDFPSIILQQGGYLLWIARDLAEWKEYQAELLPLVEHACRFWSRRATARGAFEEYYPWEQGYPPLAFSTLAVMKLAGAGAVDPGAIAAGAAVAARQLTRRFEAEAANQQVAGLAALAWLRRLYPGQCSAERFEAISARTLALQRQEGWFDEYGGPDTGYLSVTIECLFDAYDATGREEYLRSIERAARFLVEVTHAGRHPAGMHNSRNTDYVLPYGVIRASLTADIDVAGLPETAWRLFEHCSGSGHFLAAVDDRYCNHYIGHSVLRALALLREPRASRPPPPPPPPARDPTWCRQAGYLLRPWTDQLGYQGTVSTRKGGVVTASAPGIYFADPGWIVKDANGEHITHWWSDTWRVIERTDAGLVVEGHLFRHREPWNTPARQAMLRVLSYLFGHRLIGVLKRRLILRKAPSPYRYRRQVRFAPNIVLIDDTLQGVDDPAHVLRAPRTSKRHVASADSFHVEDLALTRGVQVTEKRVTHAGGLSISTVYAFPAAETLAGTDSSL